MVSNALHSGIDLVERGYRPNPDWSRDFREDQDKKTKLFDEFLEMTIREHTKYQRTVLEDVYFTKYWGWNNYCLVFKMNEDYDKLEILFGAVLESTDDVLRWYDITEFINFNVYIITPYRTFKITYLDLLYEYVTMSNHRSSPSEINNHPRIQKMKEWVSRYTEYERYTKKSTLHYDPYSYMDRGREQREYLGLRDDNRRLPPQEYRGLGVMPGYYNYDIDNLRDQRRQQQMSEYIQPRPIVEKESLITRIKNKIKW
jgi:hypothetical protein